MQVVCLQHVPFEGPGIFASLLHDQGAELISYLVPQQGLPNGPGDLLLVMGGPMSVNDSDPWIAHETTFIEGAVQAGVPVLGVCLGAQFMAKALGALVGPGIDVEIGMTPVRLTSEGKNDPVFGVMPECFEVFEWHGEVFDLPKGAIPLASSDLCTVQAFRYGEQAYALLFHLEMERPGIEALCRECQQDVARAKLTSKAILSRAEPCLSQLHHLASRLIVSLTRSTH